MALQMRGGARMAAACLTLAGASWQARAEETCLTPERLPIMVDGIARTYRGHSSGWGGMSWTGRYVTLDRPVAMPSLLPGEHCGQAVDSVSPDGLFKLQNWTRVRVELLDAGGDPPSRRSRVVCVLNGSDCAEALAPKQSQQ